MDGSQISPYDYRSLLQDSEHFSSPKSAALDNFDGFSFENGPNSESLLVFSTIQRSFPTNAFPSNLSPQIEDDRKSITTDFLNIADPTTEETQIENEIHSPFKFNIDNYSRSPIIWEQDEPIFPKAGVDSTATPWTSSMPTLFSQKNDHYEMLLNTVSTKLLELIVATTRLTTQQSQIDKNLPEIVASAVSSKFVDSFTQLKHNMLEVVEEIRKHRGADGKTTEIYSKLQELSQMVSKLSNENKDSMNALKNQISILAFSNVQMRNEVLSRLSNLTQKLETLTETTAKFYERVVSDVASAIEKSVSSAIDERMQDLEKAVLEKFVPEPAADENQTKDSEKLSEIKELMDKTETGVRSISNDMKLVEARLQATATEKLQDFLVEIEKVKSRVENVSSVVNDKIDDQMSESKKNGKKALEEIKESEVRMFKALEDIGDRFEAKAEISDMKIDRILKIADELEKPADYKEKMDELKRFLENKMDVMEQNIMNRFDRIETSISEYQFLNNSSSPSSSANKRMNARNSTRSLLPAHSPSLTVMPPSTSRKLSINNKVPFKPPKPISSAMKQDRPSLTVSSNPDMDRNFPPLIPKRRGRSRTTVASASNQPGNMVSINASLTIHDKSETGVEGTNEKNITENVVERMNFQIIESGIKPIEETIAGTVLKEDFSDKGQQRDEAKDRSLEDELFPQDSIEQTVEQSSTPKRRKIMDETQQPQPAMTPTEIAKIKEENGEQMSTPRKSRRRVTKWWTWVEKNVDEGNREADILVDTPMRSAARSALRKMHEIRREI